MLLSEYLKLIQPGALSCSWKIFCLSTRYDIVRSIYYYPVLFCYPSWGPLLSPDARIGIECTNWAIDVSFAGLHAFVMHESDNVNTRSWRSSRLPFPSFQVNDATFVQKDYMPMSFTFFSGVANQYMLE